MAVGISSARFFRHGRSRADHRHLCRWRTVAKTGILAARASMTASCSGQPAL